MYSVIMANSEGRRPRHIGVVDYYQIVLSFIPMSKHTQGREYNSIINLYNEVRCVCVKDVDCVGHLIK